MLAAAVIACAAPDFATAQSYPDIEAGTKVTFLEATYMPTLIRLRIDAPFGACPAGTFLQYYPQGADGIANMQAIFSLLLTAKVSNQRVTLTGYSSDCTTVRFVKLS